MILKFPNTVQFSGATYLAVGEKFISDKSLPPEQLMIKQKKRILDSVEQLTKLTQDLKIDSSFYNVLNKLKDYSWTLSNAVAALSNPTGR